MISQTASYEPAATVHQDVTAITALSHKISVSMEGAFLGFLAVCAGYMLYFSTWRLLNFDEMLSYYTESIPTTKALLSVQSSIPVSLDPPLYHLLGHWVLQLGMNPAMSVRLPSLLGSLVMVASVYLFARRLAGSLTAAIAVSGLIIANNFHMVEARPYGILLGATGLSLMFWQNAIRNKERRASLFALFLALGLATSCHYFGILAAVPFILVECIRWWEHRKLDVPLTAVLLGSYVFGIAWLPFLKAAHQYKSNYYTKVHFSDLLRAYTAPFDTALKIQSPLVDAAIALTVVAMVAAGAYLGYRRTRLEADRRDEWWLVFVLAMLPVGGVVLAAAASGAFETRFAVEFSIGLSIAISSGVMCLVRSRQLQIVLLVGCLLLVAERFVRAAHENGRQSSALMECLTQIRQGAPIVMADDEAFVRLHYYDRERNAGIANLVWVADIRHEIAFSGTDNIDRTMLNLKHFTNLPVITYDDLTRHYPTFGLIESKVTVPPNWVVEQLHQDGADFTTTLRAGNLSFYQVRLARSDSRRR